MCGERRRPRLQRTQRGTLPPPPGGALDSGLGQSNQSDVKVTKTRLRPSEAPGRRVSPRAWYPRDLASRQQQADPLSASVSDNSVPTLTAVPGPCGCHKLVGRGSGGARGTDSHRLGAGSPRVPVELRRRAVTIVQRNGEGAEVRSAARIKEAGARVGGAARARRSRIRAGKVPADKNRQTGVNAHAKWCGAAS
jgi:hypothetical protein